MKRTASVRRIAAMAALAAAVAFAAPLRAETPDEIRARYDREIGKLRVELANCAGKPEMTIFAKMVEKQIADAVAVRDAALARIGAPTTAETAPRVPVREAPALLEVPSPSGSSSPTLPSPPPGTTPAENAGSLSKNSLLANADPAYASDLRKILEQGEAEEKTKESQRAKEKTDAEAAQRQEDLKEADRQRLDDARKGRERAIADELAREAAARAAAEKLAAESKTRWQSPPPDDPHGKFLQAQGRFYETLNKTLPNDPNMTSTEGLQDMARAVKQAIDATPDGRSDPKLDTFNRQIDGLAAGRTPQEVGLDTPRHVGELKRQMETSMNQGVTKELTPRDLAREATERGLQEASPRRQNAVDTANEELARQNAELRREFVRQRREWMKPETPLPEHMKADAGGAKPPERPPSDIVWIDPEEPPPGGRKIATEGREPPAGESTPRASEQNAIKIEDALAPEPAAPSAAKAPPADAAGPRPNKFSALAQPKPPPAPWDGNPAGLPTDANATLDSARMPGMDLPGDHLPTLDGVKVTELDRGSPEGAMPSERPPPVEIQIDREPLERMRQEGYDRARQQYEKDLRTVGDAAERAEVDRRYRAELRRVDGEVLNKARQPEVTAGRNALLTDISAQSKTEIVQKPGAGRSETSGRGGLGDVDAEVKTQRQANDVRKGFQEKGYKVNVQGDVMSVPELDVNVFTEPSTIDRPGGSAREGAIGRGGNPEVNLNVLPPEKAWTQGNDLNGIYGEVQKTKIFGPALETWGDATSASKATYKNMLNNGMADPNDPLFRKVALMYQGGASPQSAGIVRPGATPEQYAQDMARFQEQLQKVNLEAARAAESRAATQHERLWTDAAEAQAAYEKARGGNDPAAIEKARSDLIRTKIDALEFDARQRQARHNLESNNPEAAKRMAPPSGELPGWSAESRYLGAIDGVEKAMQAAGPGLMVLDFGQRLNNASYETLPDGSVRMRPKEERDRLLAINAAGMAGGTLAGAGTGTLGAAGFGLIGAGLGSIVPGVGTALGGALGGLLGGVYTGIRGYVVGSRWSEEVAGDVYDATQATFAGSGRDTQGLSPTGSSVLTALLARGVPEGSAREIVNTLEDGDLKKFKEMMGAVRAEYGDGKNPSAAPPIDIRPEIRNWGSWEERGKTHQGLSQDDNERLRQVRDAWEDARTPEDKERLGNIYQGLAHGTPEEKAKAAEKWAKPPPPTRTGTGAAPTIGPTLHGGDTPSAPANTASSELPPGPPPPRYTTPNLENDNWNMGHLAKTTQSRIANLQTLINNSHNSSDKKRWAGEIEKHRKDLDYYNTRIGQNNRLLAQQGGRTSGLIADPSASRGPRSSDPRDEIDRTAQRLPDETPDVPMVDRPPVPGEGRWKDQQGLGVAPARVPSGGGGGPTIVAPPSAGATATAAKDPWDDEMEGDWRHSCPKCGRSWRKWASQDFTMTCPHCKHTDDAFRFASQHVYSRYAWDADKSMWCTQCGARVDDGGSTPSKCPKCGASNIGRGEAAGLAASKIALTKAPDLSGPGITAPPPSTSLQPPLVQAPDSLLQGGRRVGGAGAPDGTPPAAGPAVAGGPNAWRRIDTPQGGAWSRVAPDGSVQMKYDRPPASKNPVDLLNTASGGGVTAAPTTGAPPPPDGSSGWQRVNTPQGGAWTRVDADGSLVVKHDRPPAGFDPIAPFRPVRHPRAAEIDTMIDRMIRGESMPPVGTMTDAPPPPPGNGWNRVQTADGGAWSKLDADGGLEIKYDRPPNARTPAEILGARAVDASSATAVAAPAGDGWQRVMTDRGGAWGRVSADGSLVVKYDRGLAVQGASHILGDTGDRAVNLREGVLAKVGGGKASSVATGSAGAGPKPPDWGKAPPPGEGWERVMIGGEGPAWSRMTPDGNVQIATDDARDKEWKAQQVAARETDAGGLKRAMKAMDDFIDQRIKAGASPEELAALSDRRNAIGRQFIDKTNEIAQLKGGGAAAGPFDRSVLSLNNLPPGIVGGHIPPPGQPGVAVLKTADGRTIDVPLNADGTVVGQVSIPQAGAGAAVLWPPAPVAAWTDGGTPSAGARLLPGGAAGSPYTIVAISDEEHRQARYTDHTNVDRSEAGKWFRRDTPNGPEWVRYTEDNRLITTRQDPCRDHPEADGWRHALTKDGPVWFRRGPDGALILDYENDGKPPIAAGTIGENDYYGIARAIEGYGWDPAKEDYRAWCAAHARTMETSGGLMGEASLRKVGTTEIGRADEVLGGHVAVRREATDTRYRDGLTAIDLQQGIATASTAGDQGLREAGAIKEAAGRTYVGTRETATRAAAGAQATNSWWQVVGGGTLTGVGNGLGAGLSTLGTNLGNTLVRRVFLPRPEPATEPETPDSGGTTPGQTASKGTSSKVSKRTHDPHPEEHPGEPGAAPEAAPGGQKVMSGPAPSGEGPYRGPGNVLLGVPPTAVKGPQTVTVMMQDFICPACGYKLSIPVGQQPPANCPKCGGGPGAAPSGVSSSSGYHCPNDSPGCSPSHLCAPCQNAKDLYGKATPMSKARGEHNSKAFDPEAK